MVDRSIANIKRAHIRKLAEEGSRSDGRKFDQMRPLRIETGIIGSYNGSSRVRLGGTEVMAGIFMDTSRPYPNNPNSCTMHTKMDLNPMASPLFGRFDMEPDIIELSRVVDRGIRGSDMIDMGSLVIRPGEEVWRINMDLVVLDFDGNLIDGGNLALLKALQSTVVPASRYDLGTDHPMPIKTLPISTTFVKIGDCLLFDPTSLEESVADARITITTDSDGIMRSLQKGGFGSFRPDEVRDAYARSVNVGERIRKGI
ncbi:MAG: RNA-binding protein [Thermoplasmatota archaeon]